MIKRLLLAFRKFFTRVLYNGFYDPVFFFLFFIQALRALP